MASRRHSMIRTEHSRAFERRLKGNEGASPVRHTNRGILTSPLPRVAAKCGQFCGTKRASICTSRNIQSRVGLGLPVTGGGSPDRLLGPQPADEPALVLGAIGKAPGGLDGQQVHRRRPAAALASAAGRAAHVSRNSFSSICRASRSAAYASNSPAMFTRARRLPWA